MHNEIRHGTRNLRDDPMDSKLETRNSRLKVLLIEDNPGDVRLIQEMLEDSKNINFELVCADRLSKGLKYLSGGPENINEGLKQSIDKDLEYKNQFDVILLDLTLPDSEVLNTFTTIQAKAPVMPIVVLTGMEDEVLATKAMRSGAQDYLLKGQINSEILIRAVRYAIERKYLVRQLEEARQQEQQERELRSLTQFAAPPKTTVTAEAFGKVPLHQSLPDTFTELVQLYKDFIDLALDQRTFKVDHNLSERLRAIAEQLGFLKAGPRDVVEIYNTALREKVRDQAPVRVQAYMDEARLMVLELMGHLVSFYRNYSLGR